MARVLVLVDDLMFGSRVLSMLGEAGHGVELVDDARLPDALQAGAGAVVADLTSAAAERVALLERLRADGALDGVRTLAFYSHVEADVRSLALGAGVDVVVPRSRMAREGAALVDALLAR